MTLWFKSMFFSWGGIMYQRTVTLMIIFWFSSLASFKPPYSTVISVMLWSSSADTCNSILVIKFSIVTANIHIYTVTLCCWVYNICIFNDSLIKIIIDPPAVLYFFHLWIVYNYDVDFFFVFLSSETYNRQS